MTTDDRSRRSWRDTAATRVLGSAFGWFSAALAMTLLYQSVSALADLGGYCARGGPYVIAVECTDAIVAFTPTSIVGGIAAVFIGWSLSQGFGVSLLAFAWPGLFVSLSMTFFSAMASSGDLTGLFVGILFLAMGLAPLVFLAWTMPRRILIGRVDAQGRPWWQAHPEQRTLWGRHPSMPDDAHYPRAGDWALSLGVAVGGVALGVWLGVLWFASVG